MNADKSAARNAAALRRLSARLGLPLARLPKDDPNTPGLLAYIGDPPAV